MGNHSLPCIQAVGILNLREKYEEREKKGNKGEKEDEREKKEGQIKKRKNLKKSDTYENMIFWKIYIPLLGTY